MSMDQKSNYYYNSIYDCKVCPFSCQTEEFTCYYGLYKANDGDQSKLKVITVKTGKPSWCQIMSILVYEKCN